MKLWFLRMSCILALASPCLAQDWALDRYPAPIWAQPGETLSVTLTGPPGQTGTLRRLGSAPANAPLKELGDGRYLATFAPAPAGDYTLQLETGGAPSDMGTLRVGDGVKTFTATATVVTRQGPNSDFDRLTPLVAGSKVEVDGQRGDWYRSKATGAWLDGRSGTVTDDPIAKPRLSRIMIDELPNGDARMTMTCGTLPEAEAVLHGNGLLTLSLADTEHMVFDITKPSDAANFLPSITTRPRAPLGAEVEIALGPKGLGGYELQAGKEPGELVLIVRKPVPKSLAGLIVTLDAGHGGPQDPGTVGHGGLPEKELNLRVTQSLAKMLRERGATVIMPRTTDADVAPDDQGAGNELQARVDVSVAAGANLFLSLHHNARPSVEEGKITHGTDIYWYQPVSESMARALADPIADAIDEPLRTSRFRSFHVIRQTYSPSVLIEFQYLSNPKLESDVLDRPDYPDKAAAGVVKGLEAYLRSLP